jgi:plasmid stabilization system protein ParE
MNIVLSEPAAEQLQALLDYLEVEWSQRVQDGFLLKLERSFIALRQFPRAFPKSEKFPGLHKCVITAQCSAYYRVYEEEIQIIAFFDNRMDLPTI